MAILIKIFRDGHNPAHFHVEYTELHALVEIGSDKPKAADRRIGGIWMLTSRVSLLALLCATALACSSDNERGRGTPPTPTMTTSTTTVTPSSTPAPTGTATGTPTASPGPRAVAKRIDGPADLIGGTLAIARVGDYLIANDKIRAIVRAPGREMSLALLYGGNIVDADLVRPAGGPGRDNFGAMIPLINLVNSFDCSVTRDDRIRTMAAEGVEYFVASDHDFLTDLRPDIERLGLASYLTAIVSSEITTFNLGHFNAWPLERDPGSYTGGAIDWGRAGVPAGKDFPSLGSFDLSPAELFAAIRNRIAPGNHGGIIQLNHFNDSTIGFFTVAGIDTFPNPPRSFTPPELIRQNPAIQNLYDDNFDTLEVWIVGSRAQTKLLQEANLGDWFNLLNQGHIKAATADSDTHSTAIVQAGGPRNFVASSSDEPGGLDDAELAASVRQGRLIGTSAPFLRVTIEGDRGAMAGLGLGLPRLVAATSHTATLHLNVQSPAWAEFDTIEVFANTIPFQMPDENLHGVQVPRYEAEPTLVLRAGADFEVRSVVVDPEVPGASRLEATLDVPLPVEKDTWVVVLVKGTDGVSRPIWPMNPQDLVQEGNATLDELTDGNLDEGGNLALAFSNALFIDADGNGRFDPPRPTP